jgi:hypothetical protein
MTAFADPRNLTVFGIGRMFSSWSYPDYSLLAPPIIDQFGVEVELKGEGVCDNTNNLRGCA